MNENYIKKQGEKIEKFLNHGFKSVDVNHVDSDEVEDRARIGFEDRKEEYQVYYRIEIPPETKQNILEKRGDVYNYMENQLIEMEQLSSAPDTLILYSDHPPHHIKKPLVFYVISTL